MIAKLKGKLGLIIAVVFVVAALFWAFQPIAMNVETAVIRQGNMVVSVEEDGETRVKEKYRIFSPLTGRVTRSILDVGDAVKGGETVVARIMPQDPTFLDERGRVRAEARVAMAEASVRVAEAKLGSSKAAEALSLSEYKRAQRLSTSKTISAAQLERANFDLELKKAETISAEAQLKLSKSDLLSAKAALIQPKGYVDPELAQTRSLPLVAPVDGVVLRLAVESEQAIQTGELLVEIGDPRQLEVTIDLLSEDAVQVKKGARAVLTDWGGAPIEAVVRRIEPAGFTKVSALGIEEQRVNAILDLKQIPQKLGHGFKLRASIELWQGKDIVKAPLTALFRDGGKWAAFIEKDGYAHKVFVETGHMNKDYAEVLSGLQVGDRVILFPGDTLEEGALVTNL
ncbi:efflux RND transporter periplasmic adaptor subunit [Polycladidibacter stylochi]|uniref:efflux RND transporter periplasmic adaptor subunit n=1 Tax=Polycladidibacter stylochi TaxID=1807766 RepID=UPI0008367458|nr:HlyD family efflux transporter periplasmic adaptor subunit [Pseudovibrio stylochi]